MALPNALGVPTLEVRAQPSAQAKCANSAADSIAHANLVGMPMLCVLRRMVVPAVLVLVGRPMGGAPASGLEGFGL